MSGNRLHSSFMQYTPSVVIAQCLYNYKLLGEHSVFIVVWYFMYCRFPFMLAFYAQYSVWCCIQGLFKYTKCEHNVHVDCLNYIVYLLSLLDMVGRQKFARQKPTRQKLTALMKKKRQVHNNQLFFYYIHTYKYHSYWLFWNIFINNSKFPVLSNGAGCSGWIGGAQASYVKGRVFEFWES